MWIHTLDKEKCLKILSDNRLAYIACAHMDAPYVVPIYYAYFNYSIYCFSIPGKKIEIMRINPLVSLLIEAKGQGNAWQTVVVTGRYKELPDQVGHNTERGQAWSLLSKYGYWWEPGALKPTPLHANKSNILFRIGIDHISGREATMEMSVA